MSLGDVSVATGISLHFMGMTQIDPLRSLGAPDKCRSDWATLPLALPAGSGPVDFSQSRRIHVPNASPSTH